MNWVINSGGGQLSATRGASVQYTAPLVLSPATAEIFAVSDADHSKVGRLTISITAAPPAEQAVAGTYQGSLHDYVYHLDVGGVRIVDTNLDFPATTYQLTAAGPHVVHLTAGPLYGAATCSNHVVSAWLSNDGTLVFAPVACDTWYCCYPPCQVSDSVLGGSGTWDYRGNLSFVLHMLESSCHGNFYSDQTFTNGRRQ